ncbi:MAG TPA: hypothetical protein VEW26_05170 [Allosphingosinicella sp.]|nr:hypothetical protein [Allosphingosinicella sp.]
MRFLTALLILLAAAPAAAQTPSATLEAIRRDFPPDHQAIAESVKGKAPAEARSLVYAGIDRFLRSRSSAILAAPGPALTAIEARQGALLRALGRQDVGLCATVGDRGFFSSQALAGAPPAGLDAYGVALVEAARAGSRAASAPEQATKEDFTAWLAAVARIEPDVPVRDMLFDKELRSAASADHLCRGAAAMHEAVAALPPPARERIARTLLRSVIGASAP